MLKHTLLSIQGAYGTLMLCFKGSKNPSVVFSVAQDLFFTLVVFCGGHVHSKSLNIILATETNIGQTTIFLKAITDQMVGAINIYKDLDRPIFQ